MTTRSACARHLFGAVYLLALFGAALLWVTPASAQVYAPALLNSFNGSIGSSPYMGLIRDTAGNLYGTTSNGGSLGYGTVFELVNNSGIYTEQVLHSFTNSLGDGASPLAGLIMDTAGNLYGTTEAAGPQATEPSSKW